MKLALAVVLALAVPITAQRVLFQHVGPNGSTLGRGLRPAGDVDGDGIGDFTAPLPASGATPLVSQVQILSGRTGSVLWQLGGFDQNSSSFPLDPVGIGDVDADQHSDVVVLTYTNLRVFSGRTGQQIYQRPPNVGNYTSVCPLGDWNGDGRADFAVAIYNTGTSLVQLLNGANGTLLGTISNLANNDFEGTVRSVGDLNGDGRQDLVLGLRSRAYVLTTTPAGVLRTIVPTGSTDCRVFEGIDLDGDGRREIVLAGGRGSVDAYDALTGDLRLSVQGPPATAGAFGNTVCGIGDLDRDGITDLAIGSSNRQSFGEVTAWSGRTGSSLWSLAGWPGFGGCGSGLAALGDVDGDGFDDVAVGAAGALPAGGCIAVSGRPLAEVTSLGGACGGGPFLPQLGATRPMLGQTITIVLRDGPVGSNGVLALSARPARSTYMGASTCTVHFGLGDWVMLHTSTLPQWTLGVPVPNAPQLAGLEVALQCFYSPTSGPLGFDLSNGLAARIGY